MAWTQDITHGYDAPLSTESYELPDASALGVRMLGVSLEHGLLQGVDPGSTEVMLAGLEYYLKDLVQQAFERVKRRRRSPSSHGPGAAVPGAVDQQDDMITVEDMAMILESAPNCFVEVSGPLYRLNDVMLRNDDEEMEDYDMGVSGAGGVGSGGGGGDQKQLVNGGTESQANGRVEGSSSNSSMHGLSFGGGQNGRGSSSSHTGVGVAAGLGLNPEGNASSSAVAAAAAAAANGTAGTAGGGSGGGGAVSNGISEGNAGSGSGMGLGLGSGGFLGNQASAAAGLRNPQASSMSGGIGVGGSNLANTNTNIGNNITNNPAINNNNNNNNANASGSNNSGNNNSSRGNVNLIDGAGLAHGLGGVGGSHVLSEYQENERQLSSLLEDLLHESVR